MEQIIKQLKDRWLREKSQRVYAEEMLRIYDGDWTDLIAECLKERFMPETYKHLKVEIDPTVNLVQRVTNEVAAIYSEPAERMVGANEPGQYLRDGMLDDLLDVADKMVFLTRNVLIRPYTVEEGVDHDVITPDRFTVLRRPGRRADIQAVAYWVPDAERFAIWTAAEHVVCRKDWKVDEAFGIQPNDYGAIPLLPIFEREPVRHWWQVKQAESLRCVALSIAQSLSDLMYNIKLSSYKKLVITLSKGGKLDTSSEQSADVAYPIVITGEGSVGVVDITGAFDQILETTFKKAGAALSQWGIRPQMIQQAGLDATSGYHLRLQLAGLARQHKARTKRWTTREKRIYKLSRMIVDVDRRRPETSSYGLLPLPSGDLQVAHGDIGPPQDRNEQADYWIKLTSNGLAERVDALKEIHGLTQEEALEKLSRINAESAARAAASVFGMDAESEASEGGMEPDDTGNAFEGVPMGGDA